MKKSVGTVVEILSKNTRTTLLDKHTKSVNTKPQSY